MKRDYQESSLEKIHQSWRTVQYHIWWVFICTEALFLISVVIIGLLPDYYQASTTILVDPQKIPERYVTPTVTTDPGQRLATLTQEVLSATRLQEAIDQFHLYPELRDSNSQEEIIDRMRAEITIDIKKGSSSALSTFTITYQGKDPGVVAQVTNQLASTFIGWNVKTREQQATGTTEFLNAQLQDARKSLEEQEEQVRDFKMKHLGEMPDQEAANLQTLSRLQLELQANVDALNRLDAERTMLQRLPEAATKSGNLKPPSEAQSERARLEAEKEGLEMQVADLKRRYTPLHPDLVSARERLEQLKARLRALPPDAGPQAADSQSTGNQPAETVVRLEIVQKEMARLNKVQQGILARIASYQAKVDAVPVRDQQVADLSRDYQTSKQRYQSLLDKKFSAEMAADLERTQKAETFTVLDPARVPEKPTKPKRRVLIGAAAVASLLLSVALVILKDQLDSSIKTEKEISDIFPASVPLLGSIPTIEIPADRRSRLRFAVCVLSLSLVACLLVAEFYWKVHPIL